MMRSLRRKRDTAVGALANTPVSHRRATSLGNQARLRQMGHAPEMVVAVDHSDPGVALTTRDPDGAAKDDVVSLDAGAPAADAGAPAAPAPDAGTGAPAPAAPAQAAPAPAAPAACDCQLASGPTYTPSPSPPVTTAGGRKSATFNLAASFATNAATNAVPGCCQVQQFIKWDSRFATWRGGPLHAGFAGIGADTWAEDRDLAGGRYGRRGGPSSQPVAGCGDEYTTAGRRDMANGDTYCGRDTPSGPDDMVGTFKFQLVVFKTGGTAVARSAVITVNWG